ncbi:Gfo/Idh/MocA family oxidoreductase [Halobaculum sp. WSA2]|uniref:Gfo/Idh/MocA family oxidoreductase n=1 Tax=Halobaculum saliterrae TaxID=2073113 RepID=A0A6B0SQQ2_9EURY|nr:aldo/keto reductase [Halobaculum saliterrae]MXR41268.1 Gfo/Idh/MocA family oxidoreductase [Halobaculum saliterrae]
MDCLFVGAGAVARQYAADLGGSRLSLAAVCDTDRDRAASLARTVTGSESETEPGENAGSDAGSPAVYADLDAMLDAESAPVVVNLTSHAAHAQVTRTCLAAGRHVFSEKPLALDPAEAGDLLRLARERDLALGCAPIAPDCDAQRHARTLLSDGRLGDVRLVYATAHVGRVTEWHERPDSFLAVGPLFDGAVYPLSVLVDWFGPVARVRSADAVDAWPDREERRPEAPAHVEATVEFADGPVVSLRASLYADHRSREFYSLECHGDDGTLYLADAGAMAADRDAVRVRGGDRGSVSAPHPRPRRERSHLDGPERLARAVDRGDRPRASARRAAHVVAVCAAIEAAATEPDTTGSDGTGHAVGGVDATVCDDRDLGDLAALAAVGSRSAPTVRPPASGVPDGAALRLPPVGFGCSRYRGEEYVDRIESIGTALDAGYRLLDSAELYGNESRIGDLLASPGTPDREGVFLLGKAWNTNHGHLREACEGSLSELGVDAFDCYALHWPDAWAYQGPLRELAERPVEEQERLAFPETDEGERATVDRDLADTWRDLAALREEGLTRTIGICNVGLDDLRDLVAETDIEPALVQVERHPYAPKVDLVDWCHDRGIRVVAHSPLSAPGLLDDPVVTAVAAEADATPAGVVLAWNVAAGVVPIPASTDPEHVVSNLAAARVELTTDQRERLDALADPDFER